MKFPTKVPKKITPCPIKEAIFELRFETDLPEEIIPGILFNKLNNVFDKGVERLPILEMPEVIRVNEPGLKYAAHHVFLSEQYKLQIGPRAFSIICPGKYVGWTEFKKMIEFILGVIEEVNLVKKAERTGLRYVNVFESENVYQNLKMDFSIDNNTLIGEKNSISSEFSYSDFLCLLKISNLHRNQDKNQISIVDIDIIKNISDDASPDFLDLVSRSHDAEKEIFFGLLKDEYLANNYNPEYED
ncbi:MAG: TIGR04255 family protein [Alphaproteobacteria bacterium]